MEQTAQNSQLRRMDGIGKVANLRGRDSSQALRSALLPWGIVTVLVGLGLIAVDFLVDNEYISVALMPLSSAALSIAGALLITEWILKPLYVRDVLQAADLSAEIHRAGIRQARTAHSVAWSDMLSGSGDITVAIGNESVFRGGPWVAIMEASRTGRRNVRLHVTERLAVQFGTTVEKQWRDNACGSKGSKLFVIPQGSVTQGLVLQCGTWTAASIADDPLNDDPLFLVFTSDSTESVVSALQRGIDRLNNSPTPPIAGA